MMGWIQNTPSPHRGGGLGWEGRLPVTGCSNLLVVARHPHPNPPPSRGRGPARGAVVALCLSLLLALTACGGDGKEGIDDDFCHGIKDGTSCEDGNPCTEDDRCGMGVCLGQPVEDGLECDDGSACTSGDACAAGACVGEATDCGAKDGACTAGVCDPETGDCQADPIEDGTTCDDGDVCTLGDACAAGACEAGPDSLVCDDGEICTDDACHPQAGCTTTPAEVPGCCETDADCDDGDPCTAAICDPQTTWCVESLVDAACDDDDACTVDDACADGVCLGAARDCDDGNDCTLDACDPDVGCVTEPAQEPGCCQADADCEDDNPCTDTHCDLEHAWCVAEPADGACDDGDACTVGDACAAGVCAPGSEPLACDDGEVCTDDACDPAAGCVFTPNEVACDDGDPCTSGDACAAGACAGAPLDCGDLDGPCRQGACNPDTASCFVLAAEDGTPCDDGDVCTSGEACSAGMCAGGDDLCFCEDQPDGTPCDDDQPCTDYDACSGGACAGLPKQCPAPEEACRVAVCDLLSGACVAAYADDGLACDDADPCTQGETCQAGACVGEDTCFCHVNPDGMPCESENPCVVNSVCLEGECIGPNKDCADQDDACNWGVCEPLSGACVKEPRPHGTPCDDGDACTEPDACAFGACGGAPVDCAGLDTVCTQGACEAGTGACVALPIPDGTPCDDGELCTGHDDCTGGVCGGEIELCGACGALVAGDACDDGDPCTEGGVCVADGELLACEGAPKDCAGLDEVCVLGTCDAASGECGTTPRPDGTPCDDGQACTLGDGCAAGVCAGTEIDLCGVPAPDQCEGAAANDMPAAALALPLEGAPFTLAGFIDPPGEADWFALPLLSGQRVVVTAQATCGGALDTQLGLYASDGETMLAYNDDGPAGDGGSDLVLNQVPSDGTYYLGLTALEASGSGGYVLNVEAAHPVCAVDADCACAELVCADEVCAPAAPGELEPNDAAAAASPLNAAAAALEGGQAVAAQGAITGVDDQDWYQVTLPAGVSLDLSVSRFCGSSVRTALTILAADGLTELAGAVSDAASGEALVDGLVLDEAGAYLLRITGEAVTAGAYLLTVEDGGCVDACACQDQVCSDALPDDGFKGLCVPANPVAETGEVVAAPLLPDARMVAAIDAPYDTDLFEIDVTAGAWDIRTQDYCGAALDTHLDLLDPGGDPITSDEDGGQTESCPFCAAVLGYEAPADMKLRVRVKAHGASVGAYVIVVTPGS